MNWADSEHFGCDSSTDIEMHRAVDTVWDACEACRDPIGPYLLWELWTSPPPTSLANLTAPKHLCKGKKWFTNLGV